MVESKNEVNTCLVFGGSSFMGLTLIKRLIKDKKFERIVYVNRGKNYWDRASRDLEGDVLKHIKADRKMENQFTTNVCKYFQMNPQLKVVAIIDFSCFKISECEQVLTIYQ